MGRCFEIAIAGCGGVSNMHLEGYARHPDRVRVAAVCDPDEARARATAERWGIPEVFHSVNEMLARSSWDVAVVCTPTPVRESVVKTLAAAGKPVFVEKPLADSLEEARRIVETCSRARVLLAVDQNFRYHYPFEQARELLAEGTVGRVFAVQHQDLFRRQDQGWRKECPRHALAVMGIHWLDGFRRMLNEEAETVVCQTYSSPGIECAGETDAMLQIAFPDVVVSYTQSFSCPIARTETLVMGEEALLTLDYSGAALYVPESRQPVERWENLYAGANKPESTFACLDLLLTALEEGGEPPNSGRDNLNTVALLDAAYQSAEKGSPAAVSASIPGP